MLKQRPIVAAACCWVIGIHLAASMPIEQAFLAYAGICLCVPIACKTRRVTPLLASIYAGVLLTALVSFYLYDREQVTHLPHGIREASSISNDEPSALNGSGEGTIVTTAERDGDSVQFQLKLDTWTPTDGIAVQVSEKVLVQIKLAAYQETELVSAWQKGERVEVLGRLEQPAEGHNFGTFNYRDYLKTKHIYWLMQVNGAEAIQLMPSTDQRSWSKLTHMITAKLEHVRQGSAGLYRQLFSEVGSSYLEGLVLGLRSGLDPDIEQSFAQLGLTHVLAISGLHVGVFVGSCLLLLRLFRLTRERSITIAIGIIPLYVMFTGASPSVIRAGMMSMLGLYGLKKGWLKDGLHILSAALLLMLWLEPYYALDVSFQLSFAVTAGLIIGVPPAVRLLPLRFPMWLRSSIAVTVVAQIVSFPLTIYYFNQISSLSLITNFVLVPFISLIVLPLASVVLVISSLSIKAAEPVAWLISKCNDLTFSIVHWLAQIEGTTMIWAQVPLWWILAYYCMLGLMLRFVLQWEADRKWLKSAAAAEEDTVPLDDFVRVPLGRNRRWGRKAAVLTGLCALVLATGYRAGKPSETSISFIDVSQGDSALIRTSDGRNILIDGGGTITYGKMGDEWRQRRKPYEVGESSLVPLLKQRGVRHLDAVIVTHGDTDHAGGLRAVLRHIPTDRLIMNGTWKSSGILEELYAVALAKDIPVVSWSAGDYWQVDRETRLDVWFPYRDAREEAMGLQEETEQNDASLVLLLTIDKKLSSQSPRTILFTGDISSAAERNILKLEQEQMQVLSYAEVIDGSVSLPMPKSIDVMKVAHHGSKSSSAAEWLERWSPKVAAISAGRNNRYGHPHPDVVERLNQIRSDIYRTDEHGEIQVKITSSGGLKLRVKHDRMSQ